MMNIKPVNFSMCVIWVCISHNISQLRGRLVLVQCTLNTEFDVGEDNIFVFHRNRIGFMLHEIMTRLHTINH